MLEDAIGRKVDNETFRLVSDMTTEDIKFHNIKFIPKLTKINYVMDKLIESIPTAESILNKDIKKDSPKTA